MNSNKVDIRAFAAIVGFLFLAVGTVFASSNRYCRSEAWACCVQVGRHSSAVTCTGSQESSRPTPIGESGSCCMAITASAENTPVAVIEQDNLRSNPVGSGVVAPVVRSALIAQLGSPVHGRFAHHDSHLRMSVAMYVLTSTFLI